MQVMLAALFLAIISPLPHKALAAPQTTHPDVGDVVIMEGPTKFKVNGLNLQFRFGNKGTYVHLDQENNESPGRWLKLPLTTSSAPTVQSGPGGRIVIIGSGDVQRAVILNSLATTVLTAFAGLKMKLSPDGRFIAYTPDHCIHFCEGDERTVMEFTAIFDVAKDSSRTFYAPYDYITADHLYDTFIYPHIKSGVSGYSNNYLWKGPVHTHASEFSWAKDSRHFAFLDEIKILVGEDGNEQYNGGTQYVVLATFKDSAWQVARFPLKNCDQKDISCAGFDAAPEFRENSLWIMQPDPMKPHYKQIIELGFTALTDVTD